jgi:serine/threonine protein kinase
MNLSNKLRGHIVFSAAGVVPFPETHGPYLDYDSASKRTDRRKPDNLDELISSIHNVSNPPTWRVDGSIFGTTYFATPVCLTRDPPPTCIDVLIPDQLDWDPELWGVLGASDSVHMHDQRVADLGISRYVLLALENWSCDCPDFDNLYRSLPFGSSLVINRIGLKLSEVSIKIRRNYDFSKHLCTVDSLRKMWDVRARDMPTQIDIQELKFIKRLYSSICLVSHHDKRMIFKSNTQFPGSIYHEIKVLLSLPPHPSIIGRPKGLVMLSTDAHREGNLVCGFLLEYYDLGSMEAFLPQTLNNDAVRLQDQVEWSLQLASALEHIHSQPGMFYSDLKMDNILLRSLNGKKCIVLADFEQSRNLYTWAPPEVFCVECIAELSFPELARNDGLTEQKMVEFRDLIKRYFVSRDITLPLRFKNVDYDNPNHGWYYPWLTSTPEEREAGAVYCLGRALWCIFEGVGDTSNVLGRSLPHDPDSEHEFPTFTCRTPYAVQEFIKKCTSGAREWTDDGPLGIFRRGGKVYPRGRTGVNGEPFATVEETQKAIKNVWEREIAKAKEFLLAREKYVEGRADAEDLKLLGYLERPTLQEVLAFLEDLRSQVNACTKGCCVS